MGWKKELEEVAQDGGMNYFGVAPVERFANLPEGHRPEDLLPGARSVISLGLRIPEGAVNAGRMACEGLRHAIFSYTVYGYNRINDRLDYAALKTVLYIEKHLKRRTYPIPAGMPRDEYLMMGAMSNRYAAVCAGHGEFGWSGFVLTRKDGPRVRWVTVVTDADLPPDPLYGGPRLCDRRTCRVCVDVCPVGALSPQAPVPVKIGTYEAAYGQRNKPLCRCATAGLVKGTPGRLQADIPVPMESMEDWSRLNRKDDAWQRMEFTHGNYCHRCLTYCPVARN